MHWHRYCCACFTFDCVYPKGGSNVLPSAQCVYNKWKNITACYNFIYSLVSLQVTFTRLFVLDETLKKIQSSSSHGSVKLKEEERPVLYYSRPYNYLLQDDRKEIVKALLTLTVMEKRRAKKSWTFSCTIWFF